MGKIIPMPDIEYRCWVNLNRDLLEEAWKTASISSTWLLKDKNKEYLERYFKESGYSITIK